MKKFEFLQELENGLEGRLAQSEIKEIVSDYSDIFENGLAEGKDEEEIAAEIGSPGKIARNILEDGIHENAGEGPGGNTGKREYTDFQKNINEKTNKIFDKFLVPDSNVPISDLATMPRRLGAYVLDSLFLGLLAFGLVLIFLVPLNLFGNVLREFNNGFSGHGHYMMYDGMRMMGTFFSIGSLGGILVTLGLFNVFTAMVMWATNGYTPGKWVLNMKVVKLNGNRISFVDALLRDIVIKSFGNTLLQGFLNVGSFVWGYATEDRKTVHDLAVQTRVVNVKKDNAEPTKGQQPQ